MASNSLYGNQYSGVEIVQFQWFIFQSSLTAPATPTGGSWNFQTGVGTPPSGWSDAPPASPSNEVWVSIALVSSLSPSTFTWSAPGLWYQQGAAGQVAVGTTTTLSPGASAIVNNSGTSYNAVLNFGIPQGIQGPTGSTGPTGPTGPTGNAATIAVGTTTTLSSGSSATVNNSGSSSAATFNFGIPQGIPGTAATIAVGTTTTTNPGTSATVTNSGTSGAAVFNFGIPKGAGVSSGGTTGQALIKNSNADYDTTWTTITGTLVYQGSWNASTNTPTLTSSVGTNGYYYIVSVAGTTNLNGITDWQPNDWAIFNGSFWEKIDNTDLVTSVNSYTGAVVLTNTDVGAPTYAGVGATGTWPISVTGNSATVTNGVYTSGSYSNPTWITGLAGSKVTAIPNSSLTNSTISGISLGSNLANLTAGTNVTFSSGSTYNGSTAITINASSTMVYPSAGIPNSTGSAWGTSYSTTGSGTVLALATSPTFVTPVLGTPTSGNFSTGTFTWPTFNQNTTGTASNVTGIVAVANGGTGVTSSSGANSVVLRDSNGNITTNCLFEGYTNQVASGTTVVLTASSVQNWIITGSGGQTIKLPDATTLPAGATFTFNNNQSSGTLVIQNNSSTTVVTVQSGSYITVVLLINSSAAGSWDFHNSTPSNASWSTNTLSWVGSYTGGTWNGNAVGLLYGGTGATTQQAAINNLAGAVTSGSYLRGNGTNVVMSTIQAADVPTLNQNTTGTASNVTGTVSVANGGTGATTLTGVAYGNGTSAFTAATGSQIATAIGSTAVTNATNATNLAGGTIGQVPYQTGSGATTFLANGTTGQVLTSNGASAPSWTTLSIGGGTF